MSQTDLREDGPLGPFRALYSLLAWGGVLVMAAALVWLMWRLFSVTPPGSARRQAFAAVGPTLTAVAGAAADSPAGGCRPPRLPASCAGCHTIKGTTASGVVGPDLTNIRAAAAERIADPDYTGAAENVADYVRESILQPNAYVVPEGKYMTPQGTSLMQAVFGAALSESELDALVAALTCVEE